MKVIVIGGSGFIGTQLINVLRKDHSVVNLDKNTSAVHGDITAIANVTDIESLRKHMQPADLVVLLAAEHTDNVDPIQLYYDVNVKGAANVLTVMRELDINNILFTSTVAVYGLNKENPGESTPVDPFNHYGKSKWEAEQVLELWFKEAPKVRSLTVLRPTVVFGEGNRGNVYNLLRQIKSGKFMMIGKGNNKKSMSYVQNIVAFMNFQVMQGLKGYQIFNYADKPDLSTKELVNVIWRKLNIPGSTMKIPYAVGYIGGMAFDVIAKLTGKKFPISRVRVQKFCATTQFSADKVKATGFVAPYSLQEALEKTIDSIS